MTEKENKLSLVSQFDDLCRYESILHAGLESDFLNFVRNQETCRLQWLQCDREHKNLQIELETTAEELREWRQHCEELRKKLLSEQKRREFAERKLNELSNLFGEVKEVVNRDNTLADHTKEKFAMWQRNEPMDAIQEDDSDLSDQSNFYDKSEDDLDINFQEIETEPHLQTGKRRSSTCRKGLAPNKKQKSFKEVLIASDENTSVVATTTVRVGPKREGDITATSRIDTFRYIPTASSGAPQENREKKQSSSDSETVITVDPPSPEGVRPTCHSDSRRNELQPPHVMTSKFQQDNSCVRNNNNTPKLTPKSSVPFRQHNSGSRVNHRTHDFACKTVIRPETCLPCGRRIKFSKQALKCHNCRSVCHPECKASVPVPCIPAKFTPSKKAGELTLENFVPSEAPFVPPILYHCVNEIESRGLSEVGLYRVSSSESEVKDLKQKFFKARGVADLNDVNIHVVCAVIKDFLRSIETIIPRTMWKEFTDASVMTDPHDCLTALYQGISQLPRHNKDTLAFLILHWQRVAETPEVKMPIKNLATVLGPTVVGFSSNTLDATIMIREQALIVKVLEKLLQISSDYWNSLLTPEENNLLLPNLLKPSDLITPDARSLRRVGSATPAQGSTTPRVGTLNPQRRQTNRSKFFQSPGLRN